MFIGVMRHMDDAKQAIPPTDSSNRFLQPIPPTEFLQRIAQQRTLLSSLAYTQAAMRHPIISPRCMWHRSARGGTVGGTVQSVQQRRLTNR
jgi:hypothetical protein